MNSPFAWPGGKRNLKKTLLSLIPEHEIYVEVFAGSAKLLFAKAPSRCEVMNDLNGDVTNFFRIAKHRPAALAELFDHELVHAERFRELRHAPAGDDELHRALRFAYLAWYSYGAKGEHFASANAKQFEGHSHMRRSLDRVRELLDQTSARLRGVLIEQRRFEQILTRYDSPATFFYLDPPYVKFQANGRYQALSAEQRESMFAQLAALQGSFLLSFDDCAEVRALARRHKFHVRGVEVGYTLGSTGTSRARKAAEVLVSKTRLKPRPTVAPSRAEQAVRVSGLVQ
jgi:DNA adenine methylase